MTKKEILHGAFAAVVSATLVVAFFINPFSAGAANTYSIQLDRISGQFLGASDSSSLSITNNITLETWVKFSSLPPISGDTTYELITKWDSSTNNKGYFLALVNESGVYVLRWANSSDGINDTAATENWTPVVGTWYHLAVTFDTGTVKFYVNGTQFGSTQIVANASIFDNVVNLNVGSIQQGPFGLLDGKLDEVRVYNVARTASQIASDYAQELTGSEPGLVAYWKLNNDGGVDATANGNNLTAVNGPVYSTDIPFPVIPPFIEVLKVRKAVNESLTSSTVLQSDDALVLQLTGNKTYLIDGVLFVSAGTTQPDIKISFGGPGVSTATIGYANDTVQGVLANNATSGKIDLSATPQVLHIHGTVVTSANGAFQLSWAQNAANANPTSVLLGSYLRAEEI